MRSEFAGTARFRVARRLGQGAFGVVYEAYDCDRQAVVALKTLHRSDPENLYRFKQEFRSLADLAHPNLVSLYELSSEGAHWFFTMELVRGTAFLDYLRGRAGPVLSEQHTEAAARESTVTAAEMLEGPGQRDPDTAAVMPFLPPAPQADALRRAFRQLAEGLHFLHERGKLHRDIKPSNVLVTADGRVVILDFGLVTDRTASGPTGEPVVGTPAYMAPEQAAGRPVSEAADWYAVGVMLFEALAGRRPFAGSEREVLKRKQAEDAPLPSQFRPGLPADLHDLCRDLLQRDPEDRVRGPEILSRLLGVPDRVAPVAYTPTRFVGRAAHLAVLHEAWEAARRAGPTAVGIKGGSGLGKSALLRRFAAEVVEREPGTVVLAGRCYPQESVPYKALDGLVDTLRQRLRLLVPAESEDLSSLDVASLARLFPVLRGLEGAATAGAAEVPDPQEVRRRATVAFRQLLGWLATRHPVVLSIDDGQWGDADSANLLREVLRLPAPPLLLLVAYRDGEEATSAFLRLLLPALATLPGHLTVTVGEMDSQEAGILARAALGESADEGRAREIVREAAGNPFLIDELARFRRGEEGAAVGLDHLIRFRVAALPPEARRLLELVAVAGQPLARDVLSQAASLPGRDYAALNLLRASRLVRPREAEGTDEIEAYHDRIRETVAAQIPPDDLRAHHRRLGAVLEASRRADPETLAVHFGQGGEAQKASRYSAAAAAQAFEALAFDRAARLYRQALELHPATAVDERALRVRLGDALANAGRGAQAGEAYLAAARGAGAGEAIDLERRAADQLLRAGHHDEGLAALRGVLARQGLRLPGSPRRALVSLILRRARLSFRGLGFQERAEAEVPAADLLRIDTCWSVATTLSLIDIVRAQEFQARHLLLALETGEPRRVVRALIYEVPFVATAGSGTRPRTEALFALARPLAARLQDPYLDGLIALTSGSSAHLQGRFPEAREACARADAILRERCTGVAWERDTNQTFWLTCLMQMGELKELAARAPVLLEEARQRGDLYAQSQALVRHLHVARLAGDEPEEAERALREGLALWPAQGFHLQHFWGLMGRVETELYRGTSAEAWTRMTSAWRDFRRSLLLRVEILRVRAHHLRGRTALAAALLGGRRRGLLALASREAGRLAREDAPWARPHADALEAGIASAEGRTEEAIRRLATAEAGFEAVGMGLFAATCRRHRGLILGGQEGRGLVARGEEWMTAQGIRSPERFGAMLLPGRWRSGPG